MSDPLFQIGDQVHKFAGAYGGPGVVRGHCILAGGAVCYIVAHRIEGCFGELLHIYSEEQLRMLRR